ncbi:MAG: hypothetical protein RIS44_570 [Pseudomonadota bacterium]|jgi:hypothetical protein
MLGAQARIFYQGRVQDAMHGRAGVVETAAAKAGSFGA